MLTADGKNKLHSENQTTTKENEVISSSEQPQTSSMDDVKVLEPVKLQFASYEVAKNNLKVFSSRNPDDFKIADVETDGGLFGLGSHRVTGAELNERTAKIQNHLIKLNQFSKDVIGEIGSVYTALESLDKEYIPAIMTAVKGAEIASEQAKTASEHARVAQEDIKETIQKQKKIVHVLEKHKEKLDKLKHLENIDEIWKTSVELEKEMNEFNVKFVEAKDQLSKLEKSIKSLQSFANEILDYDHLEDIDDMWDNIISGEDKLNLALIQLTDLELSINNLLETPHLNDLDYIWNQVEENKTSISNMNDVMAMQKKELFEIKTDVKSLLDYKKTLELQKHIVDIDESWTDLQSAKNDIESAQKRIVDSEVSITALEGKLNELDVFKQSLSNMSHLFDVDDISERLVYAEEKIQALNLENDTQSEIINSLQLNLEQNKKENEEANNILKRKIKLLYIVSSGIGALTVLSFVLNILGVI